ncbi:MULTISPECIES: aminoglycoside phosphotransferase family protein [unclassified Roseitalea]|uniref:phosphotransferase family protein n=1 Tax=unclassified Roseitalea TaxID=2639107 RepID=UPI002740112E|nr:MULTISPECIES: aminoglycoside phosphotransferase family protein [unclassified Roseitalea]
MTIPPEDDFAAACRRIVADIGLGEEGSVTRVRLLTGGVSSDIAAVTVAGRTVCVKRALPRLKVAADWRAPVERNRAEYRWLAFAARAVPGCAPRPLGRSDRENGFAMAYLPPDAAANWKTQMLGGGSALPVAAAVGDTLGRLHALSAAPGFDACGFDNLGDFTDLRLDPYLREIGRVHRDLADAMAALCTAFATARPVLVHGDVSPKNILIAATGPVLLDAECATMGDGAFDVAFCLNHLLLKAVHQPALAADRLSGARDLWTAYRKHLHTEAPDAFEARVAAYLPALLLARVDGKSPVEYLDQVSRDAVRQTARALIARCPRDLETIVRTVAAAAGRS